MGQKNMAARILTEDLKRLYDEVEPLFPVDTTLTRPGMSGNDRTFVDDGFRIGLNCVLINEQDPSLLDVGLWCNYPRYHMLPSKEGITIQEAKDWLLKAARFQIDHEKKARSERRKMRIKIAKILAALIVIVILYIAL